MTDDRQPAIWTGGSGSAGASFSIPEPTRAERRRAEKVRRAGTLHARDEAGTYVKPREGKCNLPACRSDADGEPLDIGRGPEAFCRDHRERFSRLDLSRVSFEQQGPTPPAPAGGAVEQASPAAAGLDAARGPEDRPAL